MILVFVPAPFCSHLKNVSVLFPNTTMDRSKYRNPDMPVGYVKKDPELRYKEGIEIDGFHYIWAPYIYDAHIEEREDYATLSDLILSDDEECIVEATVLAEDGTMSVTTIKKEKEDEGSTVAQEKKSNDNGDTSTLEASVSQMDIDTTVKTSEKKKRVRKSKKGHKTDHKSDESGSESSHKHHSPSCRKRPSPSSRKHRSPSRHRHRSSSSHKHRSPSSDRHGKIVTYSPSPSPSPDRVYDVKIKEEYIEMKIKEESVDQPQHLFGSYHCEVCNITMNSLLTFNTHVNGKRHLKNMKVRNVSEVVAQSIPATVISEDQSKYPQPSPGVIRKKVNIPAAIQHVLEQSIKIPCPGLNYVTEIQGLGGVQYYCYLCDSVCSSNSISAHLTGFKHQLKSVKQFKPAAYEYMQHEPKYKIEKELKSILRAVQKREGMGRMAVEIEELAADAKDKSFCMSHPSTSKDRSSIASTSRGLTKEHLAVSFPDKFNRATIPDLSASDFFCEICQSHMNSLQMWEAHIRGKRHLTNIKKMPGDLPSKTKTILVDKRAYILDRIKYERPLGEPIVGLKEVRETEIYETGSHSYQCFLCGSCHTSLDILEHLMSLKHRTKYLDHVDFPGREVISGMGDIVASELVRDMCVQVENNEGPGKPAVHVNKSALFR